ncbi:mercury resistance system transport protein MerF (plasmid) [Hoeflea sp. Naph1]|uniref:mercury resistance system transport protein MerF n=1 Tax=Hoeflea sp. Naph1 TaxID=3388653 RepID=UPI00398F92A5
MNDRPLLGVVIDGAAFAALCCFTPALLVLAGVVGLSAITGYLDHVRLPAPVLFHRPRRLRRLAPEAALDEIMIVEPGTAAPTMMSWPNPMRRRHT